MNRMVRTFFGLISADEQKNLQEKNIVLLSVETRLKLPLRTTKVCSYSLSIST